MFYVFFRLFNRYGRKFVLTWSNKTFIVNNNEEVLI